MTRSQLALVTGASSGVGRAIALELAAAGRSVALVGRDRTRLEQTAADAECRGARAVVYPADLSEDGALHELAARVIGEPQGVDVLVHSAGILELGATAAAAVTSFDTQYRTNLRAPWLLTHLLLPSLRERRGQIVFINSTAGLNAPADAGAYAATKHGLRAFADALRAEVNGDGVRVLSVFLGRTATPMQRTVHAYEKRAFCPEQLIQPDDVGCMVAAILALPRTVEVTDVRMRPAANPRSA